MTKRKCIKIKELPLPVDRVLVFPKTVLLFHDKARRDLHIISCPYLHNIYGYGKNKDLAMVDFKWRVAQHYYDMLSVLNCLNNTDKYWPAAINSAKEFIRLFEIKQENKNA